MLNQITKFFKGHERTVKAKKNIVASLAIKGVSIVVGFLMIRVTLDYLDQTKYGIWLTLTSFMTWFSFFEIGLGNGLKNRLAESLAHENFELARRYVSTTYAILSLVMACVAILFFIANFYIDWPKILNTSADLANELTQLSFIVFGFFFVNFVFKLIGTVFTADQRPAVANTFGPIGNVLSLAIIFILTKTTEGSLIYIGWVLSAVPLAILIIVSIYFYSNDYKKIAPSFKYVDFKYAKDLLGLGFKFFIIQISSLVIYQSSNFIIAQSFGPDEVVVYNVGYKYFSVMLMAFSIIIMPFWSAYTEAWAKKDIKWIKNTITRLLYVWIGIVITGVVMLFVADIFFKIWLGNKISVPFQLSMTFVIYFACLTFGGIFRTFINGIGYIKLQMYSSVAEIVVFIVTSLLLIKYLNWGVESILVAMILSNFYGILIAPLHYKKVINNKAKGIWLK